MHSNPGELYRFYGESSTVTHSDVVVKPNGTMKNRLQNATGQQVNHSNAYLLLQSIKKRKELWV